MSAVSTRKASLPYAMFSSAPWTVYHIPELRCKILSSLDKQDLARFMRVSSHAMEDVAGLLYSSISGMRAQYGLSEDKTRRNIYRSAVQRVDSRSKIAAIRRQAGAAALQKRLDIEREAFDSEDDWSSDSGLEDWGTWESSDDDSDAESTDSRASTDSAFGYRHRPKIEPVRWDEEAFKSIMPSLLDKLPNLHHIEFGGAYQVFGNDDTWEVTYPSKTSGVIDLLRTRRFDLTTLPSMTALPPSSPSPAYALRERFDLIFHYPMFRYDEPFLGEWANAIHSNPMFGDVYRGASFGRLPISMDTLILLYQHQTARGYTIRLEHIIAPHIRPWIMADMQAFAKLASSSLVSLILSCSHPRRYYESWTRMTFHDLPELITVIRRDLPNLGLLQLSLSGIATAEFVCEPWLTADKLEAGGTIKNLTILTDYYIIPLFNVIRCLSPLCTSTASVAVTSASKRTWTAEQQTALLRYLREQPKERRLHLSVVDFSTLGAYTPAHVKELDYHQDGTPLCRCCA